MFQKQATKFVNATTNPLTKLKASKMHTKTKRNKIFESSSVSSRNMMDAYNETFIEGSLFFN